MRTRFLILLMLIAVGVSAAPPRQGKKAPVGGDSTSYIYYHPESSIDMFYWESKVRIVRIQPQITVSPLVDSLEKELMTDTALFRLPAYWRAPANVYSTFEINGTEYIVGIPTDHTSYIYQQRKRYPFTARDSAWMYVPVNTKNLSRYTLSFYGISAWKINVEDKTPERFHIELDKTRTEIVFPEGMVIPLVLSVILILLANFYSKGYVSRLLLIVFYYNAFNNTVGERNISADKAGYVLFVNYILNVVMFSTIAMAKYGMNLPFSFFISLAIGCAIVVAVYLIKLFVSMLFSNLFRCRDAYSKYYSNVSFVLQMLGVVMLPINFCIVYVGYDFTIETLFVICLIMCGLAELLKLFRLMKIIFDKQFSKFYLFLYLCGVEILPVLLAVKILSH